MSKCRMDSTKDGEQSRTTSERNERVKGPATKTCLTAGRLRRTSMSIGTERGYVMLSQLRRRWFASGLLITAMGGMYLEVIDPNKAFVLNYVSGICILLIAFAIVIFFYKERPLS